MMRAIEDGRRVLDELYSQVRAIEAEITRCSHVLRRVAAVVDVDCVDESFLALAYRMAAASRVPLNWGLLLAAHTSYGDDAR